LRSIQRVPRAKEGFKPLLSAITGDAGLFRAAPVARAEALLVAEQELPPHERRLAFGYR
jgi:hypothetical protein